MCVHVMCVCEYLDILQQEYINTLASKDTPENVQCIYIMHTVSKVSYVTVLVVEF